MKRWILFIMMLAMVLSGCVKKDKAPEKSAETGEVKSGDAATITESEAKARELVETFVKAERNEENKWTDETKIADMIPIYDLEDRVVGYHVQTSTKDKVDGTFFLTKKGEEFECSSWSYGYESVHISNYPQIRTGEAKMVQTLDRGVAILLDGKYYDAMRKTEIPKEKIK